MKPKSLYIHIPFCSHKCLFCSFTIAVGQLNRADDYLNKLEDEAQHYEQQELETIYLGGGTPSLLSCQQLDRLMQIVRNNFRFSDQCEITIEANPDSVTQQKAVVIKDLGINRVSLGVQSLNDQYLKFLGRKHDAQCALKSVEILRDVGIKNLSLDLMYAFPKQTSQELEKDVRGIASLNSEHLSLYTLTIEPNSRFHATSVKLDNEEKLTEHYNRVIEVLKEYDFNQYEISNFAKKSYESIHNQNYWLGKEYIGLGIGAHSFIGNRRYWNKEKLQEYLNEKDFIGGFEDLNEETLILEKLIFGLRMNQGVPQGLVPENKRSVIAQLIQGGFLQLKLDRVMVTDRGRLVLDELATRLI